MAHQKKLTTLAALAAFVVLGTAATIRPANNFKNLKVLPQDITGQQLDSLMDSYNKALKVSCDFCHSAAKSTFPLAPVNNGELDFALDNEMKENARKMITMNIEINKTWFNYDSTKRQEFLNVVSCNTCHRGNPFPAHE